MRYIQGMRALCLFLIVLCVSFAQTRSVTDAEVQRVHRSAILIDTHNDITSRTVDGYDIGKNKNDGHTNIASLIEGGHAIEDSLGLLRDYFDLGVRYMTLTHTNTNNWADSSGDVDKAGVQHHNGLTPFGKQVVHEMNRLGMIIDISHTADKTFWDALAASKAPIFASHSSCRALCNVPRNMTDEMIAALAKKGGVIQINFNCGFLSEKSAAAAKTVEDSTLPGAQGEDATIAEYRKKVPPATLED